MCLQSDAGRPIAHVAAEAEVSRRCLAKWYARRRAHGENGLLGHSSRPAAGPARTPEDIADLVEAPQRQTKHEPARLAAGLQRLHGVTRAPATVHRTLVRRGLNRLRDLGPPDRPAAARGHPLRRARPGRRPGPRRRQETQGASLPAAAGGCTASAPSPPAPPSRLQTHQSRHRPAAPKPLTVRTRMPR
ncbi:helix-turn-helix domain-containing protein [Streptomyces malaysiensis]|uniref:helix-turn-helix domain-containing protein n=1 Tax=Streptomyces malaysiensis TaxID=92644 RepID=UPI0036B0C9E3